MTDNSQKLLEKLREYESIKLLDSHARVLTPKLIKALIHLVEKTEKIGHRSEPESYLGGKAIGYLSCCEDVIKDANEALNETWEIVKNG